MTTAAVLKWKRAREEDGNGPAPEPKRAAGPPRSDLRPAAAAENQFARTNAQPVTFNDAQTYVMEVKEYFRHDTQKFTEMCQAIQDRKAQRLDTPHLIARIKELFQGHPHLILGFNVFLRSLSEADKITLSSSEEEPQNTKLEKWQQALVFEHKIRALGKHVHDAFVEILVNRNKTIHEVYQSGVVLLAEHGDLLAEFRTILTHTRNAPMSTIPTSEMAVVAIPRSPTKVKFVVGGQRSSKQRLTVRESNSEAKVRGEPTRQAEKERKDDVSENRNTKSTSDTGDRKGKCKIEEGGPNRTEREKVSIPSRRDSPVGDGGNRSPAGVARRIASTAELMQRLDKCIHKCERCAHAQDYPVFNWVVARKQASYRKRGKANLEKEREAIRG